MAVNNNMAACGQCLTWFMLYIFGVLFIDIVLAHPQCLDFRPPFTPDVPLQFCTEYSAIGCCTFERDRQLMGRYRDIVSQFGSGVCDYYIKNMVCQECSPYAAHLFDSEQTGVEKPLPGLCNSYCQNFYSTCRNSVQYLTQDTRILNSLRSSTEFCNELRLPDPDYCYPDLKTNVIFNQDITNNAATVDGCLCLEQFADRLRNPLVFRSPPDGSGRIFVGEQIGFIWIYYKNGTRIPEYFLDISNQVLVSNRPGDERGFLGLEFHPEFSVNKRLFIYYQINSNTGQKIRISELRVRPDNENKVDYNSEKVIIEIDEPFANHNGGEILFGLDGYLYLFVGDGGAGGDPRGYAQNKQSLLGKVLRIDVNNVPEGRSYVIPPDNPFVNDATVRPEIYALGIRNIWRCDLDDGDPVTGYGRGRIICGDVGQSAREEIDIIERGGNYGWNAREGNRCFRSDLCGQIGPEVFPIFDYPHSEGKSVTGGHVYRGCQNPALNGKYIYGDYVRGRIWHLTEDTATGQWSNQEIQLCGTDLCFNGLVNNFETNILSFGEDNDGEVYMLTTSYASSSSPQGKIYKFVDPRLRGDPTKCRSYVPEPTTTTTTTTTTRTTTTTPAPTTTTTQAPVSGGAASGWLQHASVLCDKMLNDQHGMAMTAYQFYYSFVCPPQSHADFIYLFNSNTFRPVNPAMGPVNPQTKWPLF